MKKRFRKMLSMLLLFTLLLTTVNAHKALAAENDSGSNEVTFGDGFIQERIVTYIGDEIVEFSRITYENNYATVTIKEGSNISTFTIEANYSRLLDNILGVNANGGISPMSDIVEGYEYIYFTTLSDEVILDPMYGTLAQMVSLLSGVLSLYGIPLATITSIAAALISLGDADVRTKIVTTRNWYIVNQEATGEFMGWYRCAFSVATYVEDLKGGWKLVSVETGAFESTQPY